MLEISAVLITRDDAERVTKLATHLLSFLSEVVVLIDDRSNQTVDQMLSKVQGCRFERFTFVGFGAAKRKVVSLAHYDWVFSIDSDEWPDEECVNSLKNINLEEPSVYRMKRLNHYCGRPIRGCGWYPDWVTRLFHRSVADFSNDIVHESVKPFGNKMEAQIVEGHILHYSFEGSHELLQKLIQYSSLYAENYQGQPKPVLLILLRAKFAFFKFYFLKKGVFFGRDGFIISLMNAGGVFHKHWRAGEIARGRR